ncbi:ATP synthase subunit I [Psychrobacter sp. HD31]|uniref:ATP synthase subunit I n=1 Tax=Psychrobacter sp. HD31 TaxID=3112003 RepID=UPI003DA248BE
MTAGPASRNSKVKINKALKQESWILFISICVLIVIDWLWLSNDTGQLIHAKSFALGALLGYLTHVLFVLIMFRYSGAKASRNIVNQFYLGAAIKWFVTLVGFSLIFIIIRPLSALALFIGFIVMQISHSLISLKIK